jgi:hypothetical protein
MNTAALRYTALRLARLHPVDREWMLQRLPVAQADALRAIGATPGIERLARVSDDLEPPRMAAASVPDPVRIPLVPVGDIDRLDPHWASLWLRAGGAEALEHYLADTTPVRAAKVAAFADAIGPRLPGKLAAALSRWTPDKETAT